MEIPETQYNNIINIVTKRASEADGEILNNLLTDEISEHRLMGILFSFTFPENNISVINYFLKFERTHDYGDIFNNTIFYDYRFNRQFDKIPSTSKNIVDLDISFYNNENIIKYYFLLDLISEIYGFVADNINKKEKYVTVKCRYIINEGVFTLYNENNKDYFSFNIEYDYNIDGVSSFYISNVSNDVEVDVVKEMIGIIRLDEAILQHLNYIHKADIIHNSREYIFNIQAFYKFCKLKLIYYTLLCIKNKLQSSEVFQKQLIYFIDKHLSYCFINLKNSIMINNVDNKSVLLTNKLLTISDDIKKNTVNIKRKNDNLKRNSKISKIYDRNYIKPIFYFSIAITSVILIICVIIYNTEFKNYINFNFDIIFLIFVIILYTLIIYIIRNRKETFINDQTQFYISKMLSKHPKILMTSNETTEGQLKIRCKSSTKYPSWGDAWRLFNGNKGNEGVNSFHTNGGYNPVNGLSTNTYFPNYNGEVIMIDLGVSMILKQTKFFTRPGLVQRLPGIFRIYGTNEKTKFDNNNYIGWDIIHDQTTKLSSTIIVTALTAPPVKGIAGGNGTFVGNVDDCRNGCLYYSCYGGMGGIIYRLGIRYDHEDFSKVIYNSLQLKFEETYYNCSAIRFYFNNRYTNPPGTSLVVSAKVGANWRIVQDNIKISNANYFETFAYKDHPAIAQATIVPLIELQNTINLEIDNINPYRYYALAVKQLVGNDSWLNFAEWELYGIDPPIIAITTDNIADGITIWEDKNYQGKKQILIPGLYDIMSINPDVNDKISSIEVPSGYKVTLYKNPNFQGNTLILTQNEPNLANKNFDNVISSIKVEYIPEVNQTKYPTLISNSNKENEYILKFEDASKINALYVNDNIECDIMLVGGGGGGGFNGGGGGGGGQVLYYTDKQSWKTDRSFTLTRGAYTVEIGKGGKGAIANNTIADNGTASIIKRINGGKVILSADGGNGGGSKSKAGLHVTLGGGGGSGQTNKGIAENKTLNKNGLTFKVYNGYFNDNVNFFKNNTPQKSGIVDEIKNISDATQGNKSSSNTNYSVEWFGYFYATVTGNWKFFITSDDASYLWIGNTALSGYIIQNALINNGGTHGSRERSGTIRLEKGKYYAFRVQFGQSGGPSGINVSWTLPSNTIKIDDGDGYFFTTNTPQSEVKSIAGIGGFNTSDSGGGGGSGADIFRKNGSNANIINAGNGGVGVEINITEEKKIYGTGGAGGTSSTTKKRAVTMNGGGLGGLGSGIKADNGIVNTGGGGGGGGNNSIGGNGGSGIIVIRYKFDYNSYINNNIKNIVNRTRDSIKIAEDKVKLAEDKYKEIAKKEDDNRKALDDIQKEIDDLNRQLANPNITPLDRDIVTKKLKLAEEQEKIKQSDDKILSADRIKAQIERDLEQQNLATERLNSAKINLQNDIDKLNNINSEINRLKNDLSEAISNKSEKDEKLKNTLIEKGQEEAKLAAANVKESFNQTLIENENKIKTELAQQYSNVLLEYNNAKSIADRALKEKKDLESRNDTYSISKLTLANEQLNRALAEENLIKQKAATEEARIKAEVKSKTAQACQELAANLTRQFNEMKAKQDANTQNIARLTTDTNTLSSSIQTLTENTNTILTQKNQQYQALETQRNSQINTLNNNIKAIQENIDSITAEINTFVKNTITDNQRSDDIEKELLNLAREIAAKTMELQQYTYVVKVLDINNQSNDIGVKIIVNINNTATYIVNSIVLSSIIREQQHTVEQNEFIENTDQRSKADINIKRQDEAIMISTINLSMNMLLLSVIVIIVNNNIKNSYISPIYILGIIYIILLIPYLFEIIPIVKTKSTNKYWQNPNKK